MKKELKQKVSEAFANDSKKVSSQVIRDLIDEYIPDKETLTEKERAIECIKSLSRIEGCAMGIEGLKRTPIIYDNLDYIMNYFTELLKELDR